VKSSNRSARLAAWLFIVLLVAASLAAVAIPVWLIMPFKPQTERGLALSYALRRWAPILTVFTLIAVFALVLWLWRGTRRWWGKMALAGLFIFMAIPAWFARQNHFEWMFKPLAAPAYAAAGDSGFVSEADKVIAVELNEDAAAYPVRQLAYHHVVPDVVGGVPVVVTY
jgi:uncharacterized BrkB/YihY/UPF0761 family membrane protein